MRATKRKFASSWSRNDVESVPVKGMLWPRREYLPKSPSRPPHIERRHVRGDGAVVETGGITFLEPRYNREVRTWERIASQLNEGL